MSRHRFDQVDVFGDGPFTGNPLAVVHDAEGVSTDQMQRLTQWTNLSEAAFLLPATDSSADYRVRIFEPKSELPFAGHPTLGACAAWLDAGGVPHRTGRVVQQCGAGLIQIRIEDGRIGFAAPPPVRTGPVDASALDRVLGILGVRPDEVVAAQWIDNGPGWMGLQLRDAHAVLDLAVPAARAQHFDVGIVGLHPAGAAAAVEVRAFFNDTSGSIREDPVTGSLNASVAQWLLGDGILSAPYVARQTSGRVEVDQADGEIWVGGRTEVRITGTIDV